MTAAQAHELVPALDGSALTLSEIRLSPGNAHVLGDPERDMLLYVFAGSGSFAVGGDAHQLLAGAACLVLAGEDARLESGDAELGAICAAAGPDADRHAPMGARQSVVRLEDARGEKATGARSFQILFGPHNGSTRATLFAGFIPPGRAPWHYHLYDEIVWVPDGPGRLHSGETPEDLRTGSSFRLRPRQLHIVENLSATREMTVIGVFTPAGNPSAAYVMANAAADHRFAG